MRGIRVGALGALTLSAIAACGGGSSEAYSPFHGHHEVRSFTTWNMFDAGLAPGRAHPVRRHALH